MSAPATPRAGRASGLDEVLADVAAGAAARDAAPSFPADALDALGEAGVLALTVPPRLGASRTVDLPEEWATVRAVARADASVGRILDGHLNAVERLDVSADEPLRSEELASVALGQLRLGVWGADPAPGEGEPARLTDERTIEGVKVFCSGAGGLDRALVLVRGKEPGPPLLAYVDLGTGVEVDRSWFRGAGMRASESHRVVFSGAPALAVLGGPGEIAREPFFGRDAVRTSATWAGVADAAVDDLVTGLRAREASELADHAAGRALAARGTIDAWLTRAATVAADPEAPLADFSIALRHEVAAACRRILATADDALGSRPRATGSALERAGRDLGLFLLQHRLDPLVARMGGGALR